MNGVIENGARQRSSQRCLRSSCARLHGTWRLILQGGAFCLVLAVGTSLNVAAGGAARLAAAAELVDASATKAGVGGGAGQLQADLARDAVCPAAASEAGGLPPVTISAVRRIFHNGEHNAFTDLCRFGGRLYIAFRSCPDGHMAHPTASIIVLCSSDGAEWEQTYRFRVPLRDTRDPHFLVFNERLFVYTGTWYTGSKTIPPEEYDLNQHLGYAVWTEDGTAWHGPSMLEGTFGHYIWRAAAHGGRAYLCGRRKPGFEIAPRGEPANVESLMLESEDGLIWRKRAVFQEAAGDETAFLFEADGRVVAIGRHSEGKEAQLLRSKPPYTSWERKSLDRPIGGPLIATWAGRYVVGGRKYIPGRGSTTVLYWLVEDRLVEFAELPSGGDNSYPGFVELSPTRAFVSYYSSHETDSAGQPVTAIYLAELCVGE